MCLFRLMFCVCVFFLLALCSQRPERALDSLELKLQDYIQMVVSQHGWWKYNPGSLEEKQVFLTTDLSPKPKFTCFSKIFIFFNVSMGLHHR